MKRFIFSARFLKVLFGAAWVFLLTWPGYSQILTATVTPAPTSASIPEVTRTRMGRPVFSATRRHCAKPTRLLPPRSVLIRPS